MKIDIKKIRPNPNNARKKFTGIKELAEDIMKNGLLQKILVRPVNDFFEIVCGERRFRALELLQRDKIDCDVRILTEEEAERLSLVENMQREDLSPIELAREFKKRLEKQTQQELAKDIGKSQPYINKILNYLELPKLAQVYLDIGLITKEHAKELLRFQKLLNKIGLDKKERYKFNNRAVSFSEDYVDIATEIIIDYNKNAKQISKGIDNVVFGLVREMVKEHRDKVITRDQAEMIRWSMQKDIEWCRHEWTEGEEEGDYCLRCGCVKPKQ